MRRRRRGFRAWVVALPLLAAPACGPPAEGPPVSAREGRLVAQPGGGEMILLMELRNQGDAADTLVSLDVAGARGAALHGSHGGAAGEGAMLEVGAVVLPPGRRLAFSPGGVHGMVEWMTPPAPGDTVEVTLRFALAGALTLRVPVRDSRE